MALSPRARPHTVHLAFSDADVTDTYRDDHSSNATASSPRARHPRGDTPLSVHIRQPDPDEQHTVTSPGRWSVGRRSTSDRDEPGHDLRGWSNLEKLLTLLDQDDQDEAWAGSALQEGLSRSIGLSTPPPPPLPASYEHRSTARPPSAPTTMRKHAASFPRPSSSVHATHSVHPNSVESPMVASSAARRPSPRRAIPPPPWTGRAPSAAELLQRAHSGLPVQRDGLPDSPSPRPGSVAALRRSEADRSGLEGVGAHDNDRPSGAAAHNHAGLDPAAYHQDTVASIDSIPRVAEAALQEFDEMVSQHSFDGRPASHLRGLRLPDSERPPITTDLGSSPRPSNEGVVQDLTLQLVQELRDAQDYIAYLQNELHSINDVVLQLREKPNPVIPEGDARRALQQGRLDSQQSDEHLVEQTTQAAFEHSLAMLPALPSSTSPLDMGATSPSVLSLGRALAFTRSVDQLAHQSQDLRRDEDVFQEDNLRRVLRLVKEWASGSGAGNVP